MKDLSIIQEVYDVILDRKENPKESSYVCSLLEDENKILKKVSEESGELIVAAKCGNKDEIIHESADLIFHTLVLMASKGVSLEDLSNELRKRRK
ncbi:MAG: phosphoribosyl-ATP diphosphatase [Methanosarcinales archaeon]|nr:MAG: phosphoribosyl-ATP diphosphatase [Methanosarcinales archaeon]